MESESESISEHVSCMEEAARDPAQQGEDGTGTDEETEKAWGKQIFLPNFQMDERGADGTHHDEWHILKKITVLLKATSSLGTLFRRGATQNRSAAQESHFFHLPRNRTFTPSNYHRSIYQLL